MDALIIIIIVVIIVLAVIMIGLYNNLIKLRNAVDNAWAQVDVQLQRRLDLIPNLVETVKGYATHEKSTFMEVTQARTAGMDAKTPEAKMEAENQLTGALKTLFAVAEAYPDLKANTNFLDLQAQLKDAEDKISYMRQSYNDMVMKFNNAIQTFPAVLFAGMMGFTKRESFDAAVSAESVPVVDFGQGNSAPAVNMSDAGEPMQSAPVPGAPDAGSSKQ